MKRKTDRSVEFKIFPSNNWFKLLAVMDTVRMPQSYIARRPRSMNDLIERCKELSDQNFAFGGIIGASHYYPGIDLAGIHRIDISVLNWKQTEVEKFIRYIDPGLKGVKSGELPQVVVHNLSRPESLFSKDSSFPIADEVECLLDLHEARLESQAKELLDHLMNTIGGELY